MVDKIYLNNDWDFYDEFDDLLVQNDLNPKIKKQAKKIRIPHTVAETPYNNFSEKVYQKICLYRKEFKTDSDWQGKLVLLTVGAAAHQAEVFLNGKSLYIHNSGYTAFTVDLTGFLSSVGRTNLLAIKVDSRETLDVPPFGYVIDYMTYGGIYRDVYLEIKNPVYIEDVFVKTKSNHLESEITLNTNLSSSGMTIHQKVVSAKNNDGKQNTNAEITAEVENQKILASLDAQNVDLWTLENPALYYLVTELKNQNGETVDTKTVRFGFREVRFDESGFYLNGKKIKLRGLNRHQSFPYVGYAMPKNMQIDDADILKFELGVNYVRTSHYPQSQYFLDRCDELGLLVFTEAPGWQHIGGEKWQMQHLENVREMILQYRNHPSVFMWGVRINESKDFDELYIKANEIAHSLDPTRPTGGVRIVRNSNLLEDVYTYNDFTYCGKEKVIAKKEDVTKTHKGYMITEYNGHGFPTKMFDDELHRSEHAARHATVLDAIAEDEKIGGSSGWCAFDYNTHKDFGSGDKICYHGVMDMFRNPKYAAYVYQSQAENEIAGNVLELSSSMDIGEYPASILKNVWIFTNADLVKLYVNGDFVRDYTKKDSVFTHLPHGPIRLIDENGKWNIEDFKHATGWGKANSSYKLEAYKNSKLVKTIIKAPGNSFHLETKCARTTLYEAESYDAVEVRLRYVDENSNVQSYCQEAVTLSADGGIEIIGPKAVSLKGGCGGVFVKTTGKTGKAALVITDWTGEVTRVEFVVQNAIAASVRQNYFVHS